MRPGDSMVSFLDAGRCVELAPSGGLVARKPKTAGLEPRVMREIAGPRVVKTDGASVPARPSRHRTQACQAVPGQRLAGRIGGRWLGKGSGARGRPLARQSSSGKR